MSLLGALTGSDAAKAAKRAAGLQANAANQAGGLLNTAYLDGGKLQANGYTLSCCFYASVRVFGRTSFYYGQDYQRLDKLV